MAETKIEWATHVWNPVRGCTPRSTGCANCYAARQALRMAGPGKPYEGLVENTKHGPRWTGRVVLDEEKLREPRRWRKPRGRVFVNSMSDLFHDSLAFDDIMQILVELRQASATTFIALTKRPDVALKFHNLWMGGITWPPNLWLGVSVENQAAADRRIPTLLRIPAAKRIVSCEPLLGAVSLDRWVRQFCWCPQGAAPSQCDPWMETGTCVYGPNETVDGVIAGCETGPKARPTLHCWAESLRDQCVAAGVPFFLKQLRMGIDGQVVKMPELDGRVWDQLPGT